MPGGLDDRTHAAARDDAGSGRGGLEQHATATEFADDFMRNGILVDGHLDHPFLRRLGRLANGLADFVGLAKPMPTRPLWLPETISALKLKRRPPLTTLAQRLMKTTFSVVSFGSVYRSSPDWILV